MKRLFITALLLVTTANAQDLQTVTRIRNIRDR